MCFAVDLCSDRLNKPLYRASINRALNRSEAEEMPFCSIYYTELCPYAAFKQLQPKTDNIPESMNVIFAIATGVVQFRHVIALPVTS